MSISIKSTKSEILAAYELLQAQVAQLERNANDDQRRIGVMMYDANQLQHRVNELESEVEDLSSQLSDINEDELTDTIESQRDIIKVQAERIKLLGMKVAAQPKSAPRNPKPLPVSAEVESQPTVEITDFDRAMYRKFNALPREQRLAIIKFARPIVGHVGIHNIVTVRAAWHEHQTQVNDVSHMQAS